MIELRWVVFGPNRQLEYRTREVIIDHWGDLRKVDGWTDWKIVPNVDGDEAALGDLIASGGIVGAP